MRRYIDSDKLIEFANNTKDKTIDANDIARFPAADVRENVRGEWQPHQNKSFREWDVCSACGVSCKRREYGIHANGEKWVTEYNFSFCPNCGAVMRGDKA